MSTGALACVHIYVHLWKKYIHAFNARNVIWSCDLFLALCLQVRWIWLPCKCLFAYKITNERTNNVGTRVSCESNMSWHNVHSWYKCSHENFFTVWIEDCQNHRQMKRSLSTSPSSLIFAFTRPTPAFASVFISQLYYAYKSCTHKTHSEFSTYAPKLSYRWARIQFTCMLINGSLCAGYANAALILIRSSHTRFLATHSLALCLVSLIALNVANSYLPICTYTAPNGGGVFLDIVTL